MDLKIFQKFWVFITKEYIMKKIIKLTERDLTRIAKRVVNENEYNDDFDGKTKKSLLSLIEDIMKNI